MTFERLYLHTDCGKFLSVCTYHPERIIKMAALPNKVAIITGASTGRDCKISSLSGIRRIQLHYGIGASGLTAGFQ